VAASEDDIREALFGENPRCHCELAFWEGAPAGFALWFYNFSTFAGKAGIYLEDLYVEPQLRGRGIGKALLKHLARRCVAEGLPRFQWSVLNWNTPSIAVYEAMGAKPVDDWTVYRLTGPELEALAS
jgi:GNAT superfamily N-acetyltransferase